MEYVIDLKAEEHEIKRLYRHLISGGKHGEFSKEKMANIRKAFNFAVKAHEGVRRKSGEPYIYHPIQVALICVHNLGLGETSAICALLHDVVEDTEYTLEDIKNMFGDKVADIIDGLTKVNRIIEDKDKEREGDEGERSQQSETILKILLATTKDVRVILIKLADRLHNMRTLDSMKGSSQLKIASETSYFFAPFAHRLGLYEIKTELEDLSLKYLEPEVYKAISRKIIETSKDRDSLINNFIYPIKLALGKEGIKYTVTSRMKSVYSIWKKMKKKKISFEDIYDLFAVRIIIDPKGENEKSACFKVYSLITDIYEQKADRMRDWISHPKSNGYESLHTTLMSNDGKWVEVQIRTERMNDIAEMGYAAHWRYKTAGSKSGLDNWLIIVSNLIKTYQGNPKDIVNEFNLNLFDKEIAVYTPKGERRILPLGSTVLDFAYSIHSEVGNTAMYGEVEHVIKSLSHVLKSGDQVKIISSPTSKPEEGWLKIVKTSRAIQYIKKALKKEKQDSYDKGKSKLEDLFKKKKLEFTAENINKLMKFLNIEDDIDLYFKIAKEEIGENEIKNCFFQKRSFLFNITPSFMRKNVEEENVNEKLSKRVEDYPEEFILGDIDTVNFKTAECCTPIPGDEVMGFIKPDNSIEIHRINCSNAIHLMTQFGDRIIKIKLRSNGNISVLTGIVFVGTDKKGLLKDITEVISEELNINIRSLNVRAHDGIVKGDVQLYVKGIKDLKVLIKRLKRIKNIRSVYRIDRISSDERKKTK